MNFFSGEGARPPPQPPNLEGTINPSHIPPHILSAPATPLFLRLLGPLQTQILDPAQYLS